MHAEIIVIGVIDPACMMGYNMLIHRIISSSDAAGMY